MELEIIRRTLDLHPCGGLFVWFGPPGSGKTTTARHLVKKTAQDFSLRKLTAFRAAHLHAQEIQPASFTGKEKLLGQVHQTALRFPLASRDYSRSSESNVALLLHELQAEKVEMIIVDDADLLSPATLRGIMSIYYLAQSFGYIFSLVLIGTEGFPHTVHSLPTIFRHVTAWFYFEESKLYVGSKEKDYGRVYS